MRLKSLIPWLPMITLLTAVSPAQAAQDPGRPPSSPVVEIKPAIKYRNTGGDSALAIVNLPDRLPANFRFYTKQTVKVLCFNNRQVPVTLQTKFEISSGAEGALLLKQVAISYHAPKMDHPILGGQGGVNAGAFRFRPAEEIDQLGDWSYYNMSVSAKKGNQAFFVDRHFADIGDSCRTVLAVEVKR
jgi:hypothetical protein